MNAPFPYFGGKSSVADVVWLALGSGDIGHYIEPFFGSGAVLLNRPDFDFNSAPTESVCDKDGFIANVWRALQHEPDAVAKVCDWPVNHADLSARKQALCVNENHLLDNLASDPDWFDVKLAGYWIWAASCWIGSGLTCLGQRPHISRGGMGVHKKSLGQIPDISLNGKGVHKKSLGQRPHISRGGMGVHKTSLGMNGNCNAGGGNGVTDPYCLGIYEWFRLLSERMRYVRVVCGDWTRVCGGTWQDSLGVCGMFFDPPYGVADRRKNIYRHDGITIAADVMQWCVERGGNARYRIVLAGYEEYQELVEHHGWRSESWKSGGGYGNIARSGKRTRGKNNRHREMLYFSPHCLDPSQNEQGMPLFDQDQDQDHDRCAAILNQNNDIE